MPRTLLSTPSVHQPEPTGASLSPVGRAGCAYTAAGLVGATPVLWIDRPFNAVGCGFWAKLEAANPGGIKDRAALYMVARARQTGLLGAGAPIIESSSGTFALGLTLAGAVYGHPVTIVTDPGLEDAMRQLLRAYGATVHLVDRPHQTGGWQQARRDRVDDIRTAQPGAWCPNQYDNPDNVTGYAPLAAELVEQLGRVDVLVCSVGTGGHSAGIFTPLRQHNPDAELVGVDTIGSVLFGQPARPRLMRGLGNSIVPGNLDRRLFAEVHWVAPAEAVWAARRLAAAHAVSGGWSVGAVALVAGWLARTRPAGTRIVAVFPDGPHRYTGSIFDDDYCTRHDLWLGQLPHEPAEIEHHSQREVTAWTRCRTGGAFR